MGTNEVSGPLTKANFAYPQFQVAGPIVVSHAILVVNRLTRFQYAAQLLFQYKPPFGYMSTPWNNDDDVAISVPVLLPRFVFSSTPKLLSPTLTTIRERVSSCFPTSQPLGEGKQVRGATCKAFRHVRSILTSK